MDVPAEISKRQDLYDTMVINPEVQTRLDAIVSRILANQSRYEAVSHHFPNPGLKWWLVSAIHSLECDLNFNCYLGNGQPLNQVTTIVPKGRGPFDSFEAGAIDAIELQGLDKTTDWSMGNVLFILEGYNGYGYTLYHHINSPYLWAGSNHYLAGKYVSDGHFDPNAVSNQIGVALILKQLGIN